MAKYTKVWEDGIETSTLHFRGQDFTLTMGRFDEDGLSRSKEKAIENQMEEKYPEDENLDEIMDYMESLDDDFDRENALEGLSNLEPREGT